MREGLRRPIIRERRRGVLALPSALAFLGAAGLILASPGNLEPIRSVVVSYSDPAWDAAPRRTDVGALLPFDPDAHRLIELTEFSLGEWLPLLPELDLFTGAYLVLGGFLRLDVIVDGLVNPPGDVAPPFFDPFAFGPHPIYGFIELDVDVDEGTGGELDAPEYRYLANVVRFGGKPAGAVFADRVALESGALDGDFVTAPFVERSGEEFHLALLGGLFDAQDVTVIVGDGDTVFEAGEVWNITAPLLHRAHGYEIFSLALGGDFPGQYCPPVTVRFAHDVATDRTRITVVFPLDNLASSLMRVEVIQPENADPSDQASVSEALRDLRDSAEFVRLFGDGRPEEAIILPWENKNPASFLNPAVWRVTALMGTAYTAPDPLAERYVWTDVFPNPVRGDVDGDGTAGPADRALIQPHVPSPIPGFAEGFSVFDVNHNGIVDSIDVALVSLPGDLDGDDDLDLRDFSSLQACVVMTSIDPGWASCALADLDADGDVDSVDARRFMLAFDP